MSAFNCQTQIPPVPGLKGEELTVGRVFQLTCTGPWPSFHEGNPLRAELPPEQKYAIKILSSKKTSNDTIELTVTSYLAGKVEIPNLVVSDGAGAKAELGPQKFEVASVLDPTTKQEPYGPIGPLSLPIPGSWWVALALVLAVIALVVGILLRHRLQKQRLREMLREHDSALSPLAELHQKWRRLQRGSEIFAGGSASPEEARAVAADLEKGFRVYLLRRFEIPLAWGDRLVAREIQRAIGDDAVVKDLRRLLKELAASRSANVQARDVIQLTEESRRLAEALDPSGVRA